MPVLVYYFGQFPNLFLVTNFVAIPMSSAILIGEIFLCSVEPLNFIARVVGNILEWLIRLLDGFILRVDRLPFSTCGNIQLYFFQVILLYAIIAKISYMLMMKNNSLI
jgi:competence protein ComEC